MEVAHVVQVLVCEFLCEAASQEVCHCSERERGCRTRRGTFWFDLEVQPKKLGLVWFSSGRVAIWGLTFERVQVVLLTLSLHTYDSHIMNIFENLSLNRSFGPLCIVPSYHQFMDF